LPGANLQTANFSESNVNVSLFIENHFIEKENISS
jgi:hypothetical protein